MKNIIGIILFVYLLLPISVFALDEYNMIYETKYYKTVTTFKDINLLSSFNKESSSYTEEITKEEFDNYNPNNSTYSI